MRSDYLNADKVRAIRTVTGGLQGPVTVNGEKYNGVMPAWTLSDEDVAAVLTYVYGSWGNSGKDVSAKDVKPASRQGGQREGVGVKARLALRPSSRRRDRHRGRR